MQRFKGKVVIVTGAGSGIGEATARRFSAEGAAVVLADRERRKLSRVADLPRERTHVHVADVSGYKQVQSLVAATIKAFGGLHVLVNNAGIVVVGQISDNTPADWEK